MLTLTLIVMLDGHTGWSSRSLIANLVVTQAVALAGRHPATLVVVLVVALAEQYSGLSSHSLLVTLAVWPSDLSSLWLAAALACRHAARTALRPSC